MPMYFGPEVDAKIIEYRNEGDITVRNDIFTHGIRPAMLKLIESQMYLYGFYKIDDPEMLKNECLSTLYETLPKFDPSKGKKAFSYFNVVVKNWFIWKIRDKNKKLKQQSENFYGIDHDIVKANPSMVLASYEDEVVEREFWISLHRDMDTRPCEWRARFGREMFSVVLIVNISRRSASGLVLALGMRALGGGENAPKWGVDRRVAAVRRSSLGSRRRDA